MRARTLLLLSAPLLVAATAPAPTPIDQEEWIDVSSLEFSDAQGMRHAQYTLEVSARGRVKQCRVDQSSGDERFNKSFCAQLKKNARFEKAPSAPFGNAAMIFRGYYDVLPPNAGGPWDSEN